MLWLLEEYQGKIKLIYHTVLSKCCTSIKNFSKNILVINYDPYASSRKAAVWDDTFSS